MGPCGSAFQTSSNFFGVVLVGGGSGLASSLSVLRDIVGRQRKSGGVANQRKAWLYWVVRHVDGLLWCWHELKRTLEGEGGQEHCQRNVDALSSWLDVSIHVTGCARSEKERTLLDRLIASETASASPAGGWLVHGDRIQRRRVKNWHTKLLNIRAAVPRHKAIKVCFCGPTPMAKEIESAACMIKDCSLQVSCENFNDGKRPHVKQTDGFKVAAVTNARGRGLTDLYDSFQSGAVANPAYSRADEAITQPAESAAGQSRKEGNGNSRGREQMEDTV
jgi:hypothetical protein